MNTIADTTTIYRSPFPDVDIPAVSLPDFLLGRMAEHGDKPALIDGPSGRTLSYPHLAGAIARAAAGLAARGFTKSDVLAIFSPNLPEYAVAFFAATSLGGVVTTANPLSTAEELRRQLVDADAVMLLTVPPFVDTARQAMRGTAVRELFVFGAAEHATPFAALLADDAPAPATSIDPEDLAVLPYSSGTTGLPKGVMLTHRNLVANLVQFEAFETHGSLPPLSREDVMLAVLPFFHIFGMVLVMAYGLSKGVTIVTMPRFDLEQFLSTLERHRVTWLPAVPPIVQALAKHPLVDRYDLAALRGVGCGAAPLGADVARMAADRIDGSVGQGYGMTELSAASHINPDDRDRIDLSSVGPPLPSTQCRLVDVATGEDVGVGEPGELLVRGPQVMRGYRNNPDATAATIDADGWLHTGDIATVDDRGYFTIVDRAKELIKYKGFQVAPAELEALLLTHDGVAAAAVIGTPDPVAGEVPKAFVVARGEVDAEQLIAFVAARVAPHKKVRAVEFVDHIPTSPSGKILRRQLIEQNRTRAATDLQQSHG